MKIEIDELRGEITDLKKELSGRDDILAGSGPGLVTVNAKEPDNIRHDRNNGTPVNSGENLPFTTVRNGFTVSPKNEAIRVTTNNRYSVLNVEVEDSSYTLVEDSLVKSK